MADRSIVELVDAARQGDQKAWDRIIDEHSSLVWAVIRGHRLRPGDAEDAFQTTWLRLVENLDRLDRPDRLASWLVTTARRECLRVHRGTREIPDTHIDERIDGTGTSAEQPGPVEALLVREEHAEVHQAFQQLSPRCQDVLRLTVYVAKPEYAAVAESLDVPVGSVGPTRQRCLQRLQKLLHEPAADGPTTNVQAGPALRGGRA